MTYRHILQMLVVGAGGFLGSILRYIISGLSYRFIPHASFPYGTLVVNVLGCFFIGLLSGLAESRQIFSPNFRLFVMLGFLGGFTTFSTFGYETYALMRDMESVRATVNICLHIALGLMAVLFGQMMVRFL